MNSDTAQKLLQLTKDSYEKIADDFSNTRNFPWVEVETAVEKYLQPGMKILDLGCGHGRLLKSLEKLKKFSYVGLDNCSALITKAQTSLLPPQSAFLSSSRKRGSQIAFICDNVLNLTQFTANTFDVVFMIASFNHIPSQELRQKLLKDVKRILKPGGFLIMTNWNLWQLGTKKSIWRYALSSSRKRGSRDFYEIPFCKGMTTRDVLTRWQNRFPLYYHAFTLGELKKLLQKTGFKILENYYIKRGQKAHWFNGHNILTVAQK